MQTDVAEAIFDIVKVLPETKQQKVLDFVTDLQGSQQAGGLAAWVQEVEEHAKSIPDEAWDELPADSSINLDHYLYGAKKK